MRTDATCRSLRCACHSRCTHSRVLPSLAAHHSHLSPLSPHPSISAPPTPFPLVLSLHFPLCPAAALGPLSVPSHSRLPPFKSFRIGLRLFSSVLHAFLLFRPSLSSFSICVGTVPCALVVSLSSHDHTLHLQFITNRDIALTRKHGQRQHHLLATRLEATRPRRTHTDAKRTPPHDYSHANKLFPLF